MTGDAKSGSLGRIARRTFLVAAGVVGSGLVVGAGAVAVRLASIDRYRLPAGDGEASFGAWLRMAHDGIIEVAVPHQEMGQGIYALAVMLAAEGLRLPVDAVRAVQAPVNARFANATMLVDGLPLNDHIHDWWHELVFWSSDKVVRSIGLNATGGSSSARNITEPVRACAASMLDMLTRAAAAKFGVGADQLKISSGRISDPNGNNATYLQLSDAASRLSPKAVALPPLAAGTHVGRGMARADVPLKTNGKAQYGIDTRLPGQLYAAIRHSPRLGGVLKQAKLPQTSSGFESIVAGHDYVAVVAETYCKAVAALEKAEIVWNDENASKLSTKDIFGAYRAALDQGAGYHPRWILDSAGTVGAAAGRHFKATYDAPFLAHATMEPMNATALVTDNDATIWAGHQSGHLVKLRAARAAGLSMDAVTVVTPFLGGGFGRRADLDYVVKAVEIARNFKGKPVQTIWSRAEDLRDDFYRPAAMADVSAAIDANGYPSDFVYRIAVPAVTDQIVARVFPLVKGGLLPDRSTGDGAIYSFYGLKNRSIENFNVDLGIPVGFWRSVGHSLNNFFFETFIDELSSQARIKPIDYRAALLKAAGGTEAAKRAAGLLARLARLDAENPIAPGTSDIKAGRGVALSECFHSFVGQLADVEVRGREVRVKRVFAVVDCGFAIDPPNVMAQVRSAIIYGLSAALYGKVEIENGRIVPENFDTYPILTLDDAPEIVVEIANSGAALGGVGEIGTPGIAPAVGNAIFAATGQRLRSLPFTL